MDGDRLRERRNPAGRDHHRQAFREIAHHFEGDATATDDHRRANLDALHAARAQDIADFVPAAQMMRELHVVGSETTKVDDALHVAFASDLCKKASRNAVTLFELA